MGYWDAGRPYIYLSIYLYGSSFLVVRTPLCHPTDRRKSRNVRNNTSLRRRTKLKGLLSLEGA
jgi:hypothetical protein